ncbi:hypothetical protein D9M70_461020 [compost metagenome]
MGSRSGSRLYLGRRSAAFIVSARTGCDRRGFFILVAATTAKEHGEQVAATLAACAIARTGCAATGDFDRRGTDATFVVGDRLVITRKRLAVGRQMHGLAIREEACEFGAAHARPGANAANIHVNERRAGGRVIADATHLELHADFAQRLQLHVGKVEVHRLAEHVLALLGDALRARTQHAVGCRRTIGRDDVDIIARTALLVDFPDEVEKTRVHLGRFVATPVAKESVDLLQALGVVTAIALEGDLRLFLGMNEIEFQCPGLARGLYGRRETWRHEGSRNSNGCKNLRHLTGKGRADSR